MTQKIVNVSESNNVLPNPSDTDLSDPLFNAIWEVTKTWDVNAPEYYEGYCGLNGSHVMIIINAIRALLDKAPSVSGEAVVSKSAYDGAREDLAIWKKRALEAEEKVRIFDQRIPNQPTIRKAIDQAIASAPKKGE